MLSDAAMTLNIMSFLQNKPDDMLYICGTQLLTLLHVQYLKTIFYVFNSIFAITQLWC